MLGSLLPSGGYKVARWVLQLVLSLEWSARMWWLLDVNVNN